MAAAGLAILIDALAITFGFGLVAFFRVPGISRFGMLVAAGLASACLLTLAGAGGVLVLRGRPPTSEGGSGASPPARCSTRVPCT